MRHLKHYFSPPRRSLFSYFRLVNARRDPSCTFVLREEADSLTPSATGAHSPPLHFPFLPVPLRCPLPTRLPDSRRRPKSFPPPPNPSPPSGKSVRKEFFPTALSLRVRVWCVPAPRVTLPTMLRRSPPPGRLPARFATLPPVSVPFRLWSSPFFSGFVLFLLRLDETGLPPAPRCVPYSLAKRRVFTHPPRVFPWFTPLLF